VILDVWTHCFEAFLALYDVTEGVGKVEVGKLIDLMGNFL
jgi:hypothetical protein